LLDVGSMTAVVVPMQAGRVTARGRTDRERLLAGELVYTGVLRTPVAAIVPRVPLRGGQCPVASEWFAVSGDVHVLLGDLGAEDYTCPTPDGRPATPEYAAERLARVVCADVEMLDAEEIRAIAQAVAEAQERQVAAAIATVAARVGEPLTVITTGQGAFLARRAAARAGLRSQDLAELPGAAVHT